MTIMSVTEPLVWIDMEMTGLEPDTDRVLEIAVILTDSDLNIIAEGPDLVVFQPEDVLAKMDDWNQKHHGESGLLDRVRASTVTETMAEDRVVQFLESRCAPKKSPLAGSSVHQDKRFLQRYMPRVDAYLHYRIIDVSSVKELVQRWHADVFNARPPKRNAHRALDDIRESIDELRYYRDKAFKPAH